MILTAMVMVLPATCITLVSCLSCSSTMKMKVICSYEMSVDFQQITQHCISEDRLLHNVMLYFLFVYSNIQRCLKHPYTQAVCYVKQKTSGRRFKRKWHVRLQLCVLTMTRCTLRIWITQTIRCWTNGASVGCQIQQTVRPNSLHGCISFFYTERGVHIGWSRWKGWLRGRA